MEGYRLQVTGERLPATGDRLPVDGWQVAACQDLSGFIGADLQV